MAQHRTWCAIAIVLVLSGCGGSARFVVRDDEGGLLALEGDLTLAHRDAERQMTEHCGADRYRVVYDGTASIATGVSTGPSPEEAAARMALPSDLPMSDLERTERPGVSPTGGVGVTTGGEFFVHDPSRTTRTAMPTVTRQPRLEYECLLDDDLAPPPEALLVAIPAQRFEMGSPDDEAGRDPDEGPRTLLEIGAFSIDRTPVTVAAFEARLDEVRALAPDATILTEAETPDAWLGHCNLGSTRRRHPVNCVSVDAARAYCRLVGGDLPTEAERELVMRAGTTTPYPLGTELDPSSVVSSIGCGMRGCRGGTAPVVVEGARCNALGVCDLRGNVWEWTLTAYAETLGPYVAEVPPADAVIENPVHRGGAWLDEDARRFRSAFRGLAHPENGLTGVGFRCVVRESFAILPPP